MLSLQRRIPKSPVCLDQRVHWEPQSCSNKGESSDPFDLEEETYYLQGRIYGASTPERNSEFKWYSYMFVFHLKL